MPATATKQLSKKEVQKLFQFTEKKLVRWYDLQVELVDHLACRMEEEMAADASLNFDAALEKIYKEFGIFGFSKVVQQKELQIHKASRRLWWSEFRGLFSWPQIIGTVGIGLIFYQIPQWLDVEILMRVFAILFTATLIFLYRSLVKWQKKSPKLLLLQAGTSWIFMLSWPLLSAIWQVSQPTTTKFVIHATLGVLFLVSSWQTFLKVRQKSIEQYPEAFAS